MEVLGPLVQTEPLETEANQESRENLEHPDLSEKGVCPELMDLLDMLDPRENLEQAELRVTPD